MPEPTLYERLGGVFAIAAVVDHFSEKERLFREAIDIGRTHRDVALELSGLAYLDASLVHDDRTEKGMLFLDEALAAVTGNEVDEFIVLEEIFCQLFSACERAHDVRRADQWIRVGDSIATRRNLPSVAAFCHTHYGGVLTDAGRWPEADSTLTEAVRLWGVGRRALRAGALMRLADLRVRQGRLEEAEQLLDGLDGEVDALDHDIARALDRNDDTTAQRLDAERDALLAELKSATGAGGRNRRLGDDAERARKAVTGRIRDALRRLADRAPDLAGHLDAAVVTGTSCRYDPTDPVEWET